MYMSTFKFSAKSNMSLPKSNLSTLLPGELLNCCNYSLLLPFLAFSGKIILHFFSIQLRYMDKTFYMCALPSLSWAIRFVVLLTMTSLLGSTQSDWQKPHCAFSFSHSDVWAKHTSLVPPPLPPSLFPSPPSTRRLGCYYWSYYSPWFPFLAASKVIG